MNQNEATYANRLGYTDVEPFEIIRHISSKTIEIRAMNAVLSPDFKPNIVPGGFAGHCTNNNEQKWIITANEFAPIIRIRKHANGRWQDANVNRYNLDTKPIKFYDYNY